ncbi:MAG: hypothetical protein N2440_04170 [Actinobacteria bacterium]|nr:hypothetical protein [Actinomycetota bacterium]
MGVVFVFGEETSTIKGIYLRQLKKRFQDINKNQLSIVEVASKNYLREDYLKTSKANSTRILISESSDHKKVCASLAESLKRSIKSYPEKIVVFDASSEVACLLSDLLSKETGARLFILPFYEGDLSNSSNPKAIHLSTNQFASSILERKGLYAFQVPGPVCFKEFSNKTVLPCPPANLAIFVYDRMRFENFKKLVKILDRLSNSFRLTAFCSPDYVSFVLDYVSLTEKTEEVKAVSFSGIEDLEEHFEFVHALISLDNDLFPVEAAFSTSFGRPVIALNEGPSREIAERTSGITIEVAAEENLLDAINRFIEKHDFVDHSLVENYKKDCAQVDTFLNSINSII